MTHINFGSLRSGHNVVRILCANCKAMIELNAGQFAFRRKHSKGPLACSKACSGALQAKRARDADNAR
jgi:hypothetical protein